MDNLILLRYGRQVPAPQKYAILTLAQVGKIAGVSASSVRQLINQRF